MAKAEAHGGKGRRDLGRGRTLDDGRMRDDGATLASALEAEAVCGCEVEF